MLHYPNWCCQARLQRDYTNYERFTLQAGNNTGYRRSGWWWKRYSTAMFSSNLSKCNLSLCVFKEFLSISWHRTHRKDQTSQLMNQSCRAINLRPRKPHFFFTVVQSTNPSGITNAPPGPTPFPRSSSTNQELNVTVTEHTDGVNVRNVSQNYVSLTEAQWQRPSRNDRKLWSCLTDIWYRKLTRRSRPLTVWLSVDQWYKAEPDRTAAIMITSTSWNQEHVSTIDGLEKRTNSNYCKIHYILKETTNSRLVMRTK